MAHIEKSVREGKTTRAEADALALRKSGDRGVLLVDGSPQSGELELNRQSDTANVFSQLRREAPTQLKSRRWRQPL